MNKIESQSMKEVTSLPQESQGQSHQLLRKKLLPF